MQFPEIEVEVHALEFLEFPEPFELLQIDLGDLDVLELLQHAWRDAEDAVPLRAALAQFDLERLTATVAQEGDLDRVSGLAAADLLRQADRPADRVLVEADDDVAFFETRLGGGGSIDDAGDARTALLVVDFLFHRHAEERSIIHVEKCVPDGRAVFVVVTDAIPVVRL